MSEPASASPEAVVAEANLAEVIAVAGATAVSTATATVSAVSVEGALPCRPEATRTILRGVKRHMRRLGFAVVEELPLASGRRADVVCLADSGEIWIVEVKSSVEDFRVDQKWPFYRLHSDRLFFATDPRVPLDIFPEDTGLIVADGFGAEILREAPEHRLAAATRKAMTLRFARAAAQRLHGLVDPGVAEPW